MPAEARRRRPRTFSFFFLVVTIITAPPSVDTLLVRSQITCHATTQAPGGRRKVFKKPPPPILPKPCSNQSPRAQGHTVEARNRPPSPFPKSRDRSFQGCSQIATLHSFFVILGPWQSSPFVVPIGTGALSSLISCLIKPALRLLYGFLQLGAGRCGDLPGYSCRKDTSTARAARRRRRKKGRRKSEGKITNTLVFAFFIGGNFIYFF